MKYCKDCKHFKEKEFRDICNDPIRDEVILEGATPVYGEHYTYKYTRDMWKIRESEYDPCGIEGKRFVRKFKPFDIIIAAYRRVFGIKSTNVEEK